MLDSGTDEQGAKGGKEASEAEGIKMKSSKSTSALRPDRGRRSLYSNPALGAARARLDPQLQNLSLHTAQILSEWGLSEEVALAALVWPLLNDKEFTKSSPQKLVGAKSLKLAERFISMFQPSGLDDALNDDTPIERSFLLRRLIHSTYVDLPSLDLTMLVLADNLARLDSGYAITEEEQWAKLTFGVHIRLAEILGLWHIRGCLLERCMRIYSNLDQDRRESFVGLKNHPHGLEKWADKAGTGQGSQGAGTEDKTKGARWSGRDGENYVKLKRTLKKLFLAHGINPPPVVVPVPFSLGTTLHRVSQGMSVEELLKRQRIKIKCSTRHNCYRALAIVHELGDPIGAFGSDSLVDSIATPQPNGYQGIHTSVRFGQAIVEARILTDRMDVHNEWGAIAHLKNTGYSFSDIPSWWRRIRQLDKRLARLHPAAKSIRSFMMQNPVGTVSEYLYVFTPAGEVVLLPEGSNCLDFAYQIHTQLGNHAARIEVNGEFVPHGFTLRNGDMVVVHYDEDYAGPDIAWLNYVKSRYTRQKIRTALLGRSQASHEGRAEIERIVIQFSRQYLIDHAYDLGISSQKLDSFLKGQAEARSYSTIDALYDRITDGALSAYKLVRLLISQEFAPALTLVNGARLPYPPDSVLICDKCRPVPGDPVVGVERIKKGTVRGILVHRRSADACQGVATVGAIVPLAWVTPTSEERFFDFRIEAEDRPRLLADILNIVYDDPHTNLRKVGARAFAHGEAEIDLVIKAGDHASVVDIHTQLIEKIGNVRRVFHSLSSLSQTLAIMASERPKETNPYNYQEVYDRLMFFNREAQIDEILSWLDHSASMNRRILHGPRRIGKTSLVKYLISEVFPIRRTADAVFLDVQAFPWLSFDFQEMASQVVTAIGRLPHLPLLEQLPGESGYQWLNRTLTQTAEHLQKRRLLIIIDEFDILLKKEHDGLLSGSFFDNLRAIMNHNRDVSWLLIVTDSTFKTTDNWGGAGPIFQQTLHTELAKLDVRYASKLITEPIKRIGLNFANPDKSILDEILTLTGGNPFLIHVLCLDLVDRVRREYRDSITEHDVKQSALAVIDDGQRIFHHYLRAISQFEKIVLAGIATDVNREEWLDVSAAIAHIQRSAPKIEAQAIMNAIRFLYYKGALELQPPGDMHSVRIGAGLFHEWARMNLTLSELVNEWHNFAA